jgi:hypothetical protein
MHVTFAAPVAPEIVLDEQRAQPLTANVDAIAGGKGFG